MVSGRPGGAGRGECCCRCARLVCPRAPAPPFPPTAGCITPSPPHPPPPVQVAGGGIHQANLHTLWTVLSAVDGSTNPVTRARAVGRIRDALVSERYTRLQNYFRHLSYQATGAELRGPIVDEHAATRAVRFFELLRVLAKSGSVCRNELEATVFAGTTGELMEHEAAGMVGVVVWMVVWGGGGGRGDGWLGVAVGMVGWQSGSHARPFLW